MTQDRRALSIRDLFLALRLALVLVATVVALQTCATTGVTRSPGDRLLRAKCAACHLRPAPDRFDSVGWTRIIDEHEARVPLSQAERATLLEHLSAGTTQQ
jgi:hypothetical protein